MINEQFPQTKNLKLSPPIVFPFRTADRGSGRGPDNLPTENDLAIEHVELLGGMGKPTQLEAIKRVVDSFQGGFISVPPTGHF